jgi:hypothetical protein
MARTPDKTAKRNTQKQCTIYFPDPLLKRAKKWGIDVDKDLSDLVCEALIEYLDRAGAPPQQEGLPV